MKICRGWVIKKDVEVKDYYATYEDTYEIFMKRSDGAYNAPDEKKPKEEVLKLVKSKIHEDCMLKINKFNRLSNTEIFEKFIDYLLYRKVCVILFLPPYHPIVYNYMSENKRYEMVMKAEKYFRELAVRKGLRIVGSYDPKQLRFSENDFYDDIHPKKVAIKRIKFFASE